jgi:molybdopterin converting factor subunit 1
MPRAVTLLYFAALREAAGTAQEHLDLPGDVTTVAALAAFLERTRPALTGRLASVRFAVNESFAEANDAIEGGDVVALIPPVSGG